MGERERGKTDAGSTVNTSATNPYPILSSTSATLPQQLMLRRNVGMVQTPMANVAPMGVDASTTLTSTNKPVVPQGWTASWRRVILEKWRWGVLIALAVVVSRLSASS